MKTVDGRSGYLAHQDIKSAYHIRKYGVSIEHIESIAASSIIPEGENIIILDEIGKMECFSGVFRKAALRALDSPNTVVGTITFGVDDFIRSVKVRPDIELIEVTLENRDRLPDVIIGKVRELLRSRRTN